MKMLSKLLILSLVSTFTVSSYAGLFAKYDPYYGIKSEKCYRPSVKSNICHCYSLRNIDTCKKVMSINTFSKKEMDNMKKHHKHPCPCKTTHVKFFKKHHG